MSSRIPTKHAFCWFAQSRIMTINQRTIEKAKQFRIYEVRLSIKSTLSLAGPLRDLPKGASRPKILAAHFARLAILPWDSWGRLVRSLTRGLRCSPINTRSSLLQDCILHLMLSIMRLLLVLLLPWWNVSTSFGYPQTGKINVQFLYKILLQKVIVVVFIILTGYLFSWIQLP